MSVTSDISSLSSQLTSLNNDKIKSIVTSLSNNNYQSGSVQYAILKGFEYWKKFGHQSCTVSLQNASASLSAEYYTSAAVSVTISGNLLVQFTTFVDKVLTWVENHPSQLNTTPADAIERTYEILESSVTSIRNITSDIRGTYTKMNYDITAGPGEKANITSAKNIFNSIINFGYARAKNYYDYAINTINSLGDTIVSRTGFPNSNDIINEYATQYDLRSNEFKISTLTGNSATGLARTLPGLESSVSSNNLSDNVVLLHYVNVISDLTKLKQCFSITHNYLDIFQDNIGYNPKKYYDDNPEKAYVIGMQLYDSQEYILINTYLVIAKSLMDECLDRLTTCDKLISYSEQIRKNAVDNNIRKVASNLAKELNTLNGTLDTSNTNISNIENDLAKTKVTLSALINAHNKGLQLSVIESLSDDIEISTINETTINDHIQTIRTGIYGKDIRSSIANALEILQEKTDVKHLTGVHCKYADWISAGRPDDHYNVYFIYDSNMIIYRGVMYNFNAIDSNNIGYTDTIDSGANWFIFDNSIGNIDAELYTADVPNRT